MMNVLDKDVLVLYYHRINNIQKDPFKLCVSTENFDVHMRYIKEHYNILRFESEWNEHSPGIVITFDDGYEDNFSNAFPILKKYNIPATIFITTEPMLQNKIMWWDELYELLVSQNGNDVITIRDDAFGGIWRTNSYDLKLNCYFAIHKLINHYISTEKKDEWMQQLRDQTHIKNCYGDYELLRSGQLKILAESDLITIGGHTVSHMSLGRLSNSKQEYEIKYNLYQLEQIISKKVEVFSYPFGTVGVDFNDYTLDLLRKYGIKKAATTSQEVCHIENDRLCIPRCEVKDWDEAQFAKEIDRFWGK